MAEKVKKATRESFGETLVELAAEKGCKPTTMHQRAKRARDHLRKELEKIGM